MNAILEAVLGYACRDICVFPCEKKIPLTGLGGFKNASLDPAQIHKWWTEHPAAQIGIPTGETNHLFVLDVDGPLGDEAVAKMDLPETFTVETRPGHKQFWFKQPAGVKTKNSTSAIAEQVDTRGDGGYIIAPPSVHHLTGRPYRVVRDIPWAEAPAFLLGNGNGAKLAVGSSPQGTAVAAIPEGKRRSTLFRIACKMRSEGLDAVAIHEALKAIPCNPPLPDVELRKLADGTLRYDGRWANQLHAPTPSTAEIELLYYHQIEREQVRWLWPGRIAAGKLTLFVGDPDKGKSLVSVDTSARVSTGRAFPDGCACAQGDVLILTAEDDARDTVGPRLDAAGADSSHVARINAVKVTLADGSSGQSVFSLERDLAKLEEAFKKHPGFKLIVIDPLTAYLGTKVNSWRDAEVRSILAPLTDFAARTGIAVLGIMHMRKSETDAMLRVSGSIAFVAAARAVWGFGEDPDDPTRRVMVPVKNNLAPLGNGLAYQITANANGVPYIAWEKEPRTVSAEDVLGGNKKEKRERAEKLSEAVEFLRTHLTGAPVSEKQLETAAESAGISWRTLRRAKSTLGVKSHKTGMAGGWFWELPEADHEGAPIGPP